MIFPVLALAFDHLSAPFHLHHHDGVQAQHVASADNAPPNGDAAQLNSDEPTAASHAATALRTDPSWWGQLPALDGADLPVALLAMAHRLAALDDAPPPVWRPDRSRSDFRSHRSLPPAGRAPPLHA